MSILGGDVTKLNDDDHAASFEISPDSRRVVYLASETIRAADGLYSVPMDGGTATRLSVAPVERNEFRISPDSRSVVYISPQSLPGVDELFVTQIAGGGSRKLNAPLVENGDVRSFEISPDGSHVVYLADQDVFLEVDLYSVPFAGGEAARLNGPHLDAGFVWSFVISPDSNSVVYSGVQDTPGLFELYSNSVAGGVATKLNVPLAGESVDVIDYRVSDDSSHVVYLDEQFALRSVGLSGANPLSLRPAEAAPPGLLPDPRLEFYEISTDSQRVVYFEDIFGTAEVHSVPLGGGDAVKVNRTLSAVGNDVTDVQLAADGRYAVYLADHESEFEQQLYSVSTVNGRISELSQGRSAQQFQLSHDSTTIVFRDDGELFSVAPDGSQFTPLSDRLEQGLVQHLEISPDSSRVVFVAELGGVREIYSVAIGGGEPVKLNPALVGGGDVETDFSISADSSRVVYRADQDINNVVELYSVLLDGGATTKLNTPLGTSRAIRPGFVVSPDSSRVVYSADQEADNVWELFSVPVAGGEVTKLNATLPRNGDVGDTFVAALSFSISDDSSRVVYRAEQETDNVWELYSVPLAGGDPVRLNARVAGQR